MPNVPDAHFEQLDAFVALYNDKFAIPSKKLFDTMLEAGLRDKVQFNEKVEWVYFYLWHHEGRRARHGAAMFAPDYVHWEGLYEVAHRFYMELVPAVEAAIAKARGAGNAAGADKVQAALDATLNSEMHRWYLGQEPPAYWKPADDDSHGYHISKSRPAPEKAALGTEKK